MKTSEQDIHLRQLLDGCLSRHFGVDDTDFHIFIEDNAEYKDVASGETLIRQGEHCDAVYFLLSGHLRAFVVSANGTSTPVGEIGRGETVGELALFTGKPRGANVVAIRDSIMAKVPGAIIEKAIAKQPKIALGITRQIIERYERTQAMTNPPAAPVNLTILPITPDIDVNDFVARLVDLRKSTGDDVHIIDSQYVKTNLGGLDTPDVALPRGRVSLAISDLELKHAGLLFVADPKDPAWMQTAVHHSDEVILVANADAKPDLSEAEAELFSDHQTLRAKTTLVLIHKRDTLSPCATSRWLTPRQVNRHVHIRIGHTPDYARLHRIISGQARGIVLAGGGARGMAHLGIMAALAEAGMAFDFIGGTSAGAIMGSFAAMGVEGRDLREATRDIFLNSPFGNISGDYNLLPILSVLKGERAWKVSQKAVVDCAGKEIDIEDCWKSFFAIASNFSTHEEHLLTRGNLARSVLASFSIPGLMPPVMLDGQLLFDGGSFNNFPVDHMRKRGAAHVVGIDLLPDKTAEYDFEDIPKTKSVLADKFRPRSKRRYKRLPSLAGTLLTASVVTSMARQRQLRGHVDILFQPNTRGVGLLDWKKYDLIFERAKTDALMQIENLDDNLLSRFRD